MAEIMTKRLCELAGVHQPTHYSEGTPLHLQAYYGQTHPNHELEDLSFNVRISSPTYTTIDQAYNLIHLYQLGSIVDSGEEGEPDDSYGSDEGVSYFLTFLPDQGWEEIENTLYNLFGNSISVEKVEAEG